jgi:hypothetical protein
VPPAAAVTVPRGDIVQWERHTRPGSFLSPRIEAATSDVVVVVVEVGSQLATEESPWNARTLVAFCCFWALAAWMAVARVTESPCRFFPFDRVISNGTESDEAANRRHTRVLSRPSP